MARRIVALLSAPKSYADAGGLSVLLAKQPVKFETINDVDGAIIYLDIASCGIQHPCRGYTAIAR